ncbi:MAG: PotD/PotF family extracellular solute-binding protein [Granulosicoccus sp.]
MKNIGKTAPDHSRRTLLKAAVGTGVILSAPYIRSAKAAPTELTILAWYGLGEPDMVAEFEEANNVKFKPKYYAGGDNMLATLAQSPAGSFDIIHTDAEYARILIERGDLVDELDPSDYPFDDMTHEDFTRFPGHWKDGKLYSVICRFGHLGVAYNTDALTEQEAMSYNAFWSPSVQGKVGHFDWHLPTLGQISLLNGNTSSGPFDIDATAWQQVQEKTLSLKSQVNGFFDYGGTFASLKSGEILASVGIGDWVTAVVARDGGKVASVVPEEGGIQWTESYSIASSSTKKDLCKKYIQYCLSAEGQVKSANMAAYPGFVVTKAGEEALIKMTPDEAKRTGQMPGMANHPVKLIDDGRIHYRDTPKQQTLEDWNDFWSEYKNA